MRHIPKTIIVSCITQNIQSGATSIKEWDYILNINLYIDNVLQNYLDNGSYLDKIVIEYYVYILDFIF